MGREVRRVPKDWQHPMRDGRYIPLYDGYNAALEAFRADIEEKGLAEALDWNGGGPISDDYMPDWPEEERTHYMMYEDTSEGTPISPAMESPEALARWLADNGASAFGRSTATYEQWLPICRGGWAPGLVYDSQRGLRSGVEAAIESESFGSTGD